MTWYLRLHHIDREISLWINSLHCQLSDTVWQAFSDRWIWSVLYIAVIVMLIRRLKWRKALLSIVAILLTIVACDQLSNLVKDAVCRLRPCHDLWMTGHGLHLLEGKGSYYGFFSAHAANAFGFAVASLRCFRMDKMHGYGVYGTVIMIWAAMVSLSRVFVGKHFLGDVLAGTVVGLAVGIALSWAVRRVASKF